ncbi:gamma-glutamyl-gamma-aminobutyrate hydrolase family protein, partial [Listeria monocytogenes]|nr:gamma-glutamyl-gamma-aminobutyrate hydrolase family protein [Listeria monocytogenes]
MPLFSEKIVNQGGMSMGKPIIGIAANEVQDAGDV